MKLTDRLLEIASRVTEGKKIADIGTDHGYIPVYLLNKGIINFAVLADVNKGPLENARKEAAFAEEKLKKLTEDKNIILTQKSLHEALVKVSIAEKLL